MNSIKIFGKYYNDYIQLLENSKESLELLEIDVDEYLKNAKNTLLSNREKYISIENKHKDLNIVERPLIVGVVGGFSTGKSSFINSLIGHDLLGVKVRPATAKVTRLVYGETFNIKKKLKSGIIEEVSHKQYVSMVDHPDDLQIVQASEVEEFIISTPDSILTQVVIFDTPGFSSTNHEDDELTKKKIKELDLLIWLFDANKVGDKAETDLLQSYKGKHIIAVINKIDLKEPSAREKIKEELKKSFDFNEVLFYSAKKINDRNQVSKEQSEFFRDVFGSIEQLTNQGERYQLINEGKKVSFEFDGENRIEQLIKPLKNDSFFEYHEELTKVISQLKKEMTKYKRDKIEEERLQILTESKDLLKKTASEAGSILCKLGAGMEHYKVIKEEYAKKLEESIEAEFSQFYPRFFAWLYDRVFDYQKKEGFFNDDHYIVLKRKNVIEKEGKLSGKIYDKYKDFAVKVLDDIYAPLMQHIRDDESFSSISDDVVNQIGRVLNDLTNSTIDGLNSLIRTFDYLGGKISINVDSISREEHEDFWKEQLDLVTQDEMLHSMIYEIMFNEFNFIFDYRIIEPFAVSIKNFEGIGVRFNDLSKRMN